MPRYAFRRPTLYLPRRKSNAGHIECEKCGLGACALTARPIFAGDTPWRRRYRIAIVATMAPKMSKVDAASAARSASVDRAFLPRLNTVAADIEGLLDRLMGGL